MRRCLKVLFFILVLFTFQALPQTAESLFTLKGNFDFENPAERIVTFRFLDDNKLWLLGSRSVQVWNTANRSVISTEKHNGEDLTDYSLGELSPDGSKFFYRRRKRIEFGSFISAYVFDLKSLKQVKVFDAKALRAAYWSMNGKTFVSINEGVKSGKEGPKNFTVSFWDGETLEARKTITVPDMDWWYLSPDGAQFYTTSVPASKWLGLISNEMANKATAITVWDTEKGQVEKTLSIGDEDYAVHTWKLMPSPSGRYMAMIAKHKSDEEQHKILFWELNGSSAPKYSIKADPRLSDSNIRYSPDEKFFAVDSGKNIQIYQAETGEKKGEIFGTNLPDYWLPGDQVLFSIFAKKMRAFSVATGDVIYENPLIYDSYENTSTDGEGNTTSSETVVTDQTYVVPNPRGKIYLTYSNKFVQVYKAGTGELLEAIVRPPLSLVKEKSIIKRIRNRKQVSKAGWSEDGKTLWVINGDKTVMSLWDLKE